MDENEQKKGGKMSNIEKLNMRLTAEERSESARRAGIASGKKRAQNGTLRESLLSLLSATLSGKDVQTLLDTIELPEATRKAIAEIAGDGANLRDVVNVQMICKAVQGDPEAYRILRDGTGEKPREALDIAQKPIQAKDMSEVTDSDLAALVDG